MAGIAFGAVTTLVDVMNLVTTYALLRCVLIFLIDMTRRASCLLVSTFQREVGLLIVIKCGLLPG